MKRHSTGMPCAEQVINAKSIEHERQTEELADLVEPIQVTQENLTPTEIVAAAQTGFSVAVRIFCWLFNFATWTIGVVVRIVALVKLSLGR